MDDSKREDEDDLAIEKILRPEEYKDPHGCNQDCEYCSNIGC